MKETETKVALVTGGSSGIGLETAKALKKKGYTVYALSRRGTAPEGIHALSADVTLETDVIRAVDTILREEGRIDIVVNAAGFGISGAVEFTKELDAKRLFDTNFFGMVNVNKAVIETMRKQHSGSIVNISSVASPAGIPFQAYYSATKGAIDSYTLALRNEVKPFGITVCAVLPGDVKTGFTAAREKTQLGDDVYEGRIAKSVKGMEKDEMNGISAAKAGRYIAAKAVKKHPKPFYTLGFLYKGAMVLLKFLPRRASCALVYQIYGK